VGSHLVGLAHFQRQWSSRGREGFGFLSPSRRASSAGFNAFEKMKLIFSIAPVDSLEKLWECFHWKNTHRTLAMEASDTGSASGALWKLSERFNRASERPTGERRTQAEHYFRVRCILTSASARSSTSGCERQTPGSVWWGCVGCVRCPCTFAKLSE